MRVEIIEASKYEMLENSINRILSRCKPSDIFDIKYSGTGGHTAYSTDLYSAMIIFNDNE